MMALERYERIALGADRALVIGTVFVFVLQRVSDGRFWCRLFVQLRHLLALAMRELFTFTFTLLLLATARFDLGELTATLSVLFARCGTAHIEMEVSVDVYV
jgi:hypothetical protein